MIEISDQLFAKSVDGKLAVAEQIFDGDERQSEVNKRLEDTMSATFRIIHHDKYIFALTDKMGRSLMTIDFQGDFWTKSGMSDEVREKLVLLLEQVAELQETTKVIKIVEDGDYLTVFTDQNGKVLFGYRNSEGFFAPKGMTEDAKKRFKQIEEQIEGIKYVENGEYLIAFTSKAGQLLLGIRQDGSINCKDIRGLWDSLNKLESAFADHKAFIDSIIQVTEEDGWLLLVSDKGRHIALKMDDEGVFTFTKEVNAPNLPFHIIESDNYFEFFTQDGRHLMSINRNGHTVVNGLKIGTFGAEIQVIDDDTYLVLLSDRQGKRLAAYNNITGQWETSNIKAKGIDAPGIGKLIDSDQYCLVFTTPLGKVLLGFRKDGSGLYCPVGQPEETKREIKRIDEKLSDIDKEIEYVKTHGKDWSDQKSLQIPVPLVPARVEINGTIPTSKYLSKTGTLKYSDYLGNSFEKPILWSLQGNISSGFDKKNFGVDLLNIAGDEDDTFSVKFGNWPAFDSFHFKAFVSDFWKIRSLGVYRHAEAIAQSRPYYKRRPWDLIHEGANKTVEETLLGGVGEVTQDIHTGALGRPDGFPFMLYINGTPWGLYTWNIKKDKDNYCVTKNDNDAKQMFFGDYMTGVFEHYNNTYWSISDYDLLKLEGDGTERAIVIPSYSSSSSQRLVMESAGVEGMTLSITNSSKEYLYSVYYNGNPVTADNTWEAGDCVSVKRTGTSPDYYFNVTPVGKKWDKEKGYAVNEYAYDEDEMDYEVGGVKSHLVVRRLFKLAMANNTTFAGYEYDEEGYPVQLSYYTDENGEQAVKRGGRILTHRIMRPSYVNWRTLEVRNPKKTICVANDGLNEDGTPKYKFEYYDYDSPSDFAQTGVYERTHEIISGDEFSQSQITALIGTGETEKFSKKEYTRSVNARKTIEEYSFVCPILDKALSAQNLADWGFETEAEAKKAIFAEHHDVDHNLDFFIVYNDTNYYDSITHNTLYTMYDGKKLFANVYDTDIALGMSSTYTNSFPAVSSSVLAAGHTFVGYLWTYYSAEIKARWAELRDAGVISASAFEKMVWDIVSSIGVENYEEELRLWEQPAYRAPVYWRMAAGSLMILEDGDGLPYHGYDESVNKEVEGKDAWAEGVAVAVNDVVNYDGHSYICTVAHTTSADKRPDKAYTCGYPSSGGVYDSPRRIIEWFKKRLEYLDEKFEYTE
ncbi:MAG: carbohydrate-binding protein [Prevotella sp.]